MVKTTAGGTKLRVPVIVLALLMILSGVFLALSSGGFIVSFRGLGFSSLSILQKGVYTATSNISSTITAARRIGELRAEYDALAKQLENYELLQRTNAEIRQENERLKELLGFSQSYTYTNYPAYIINRDPDSLYTSLTISKGSAAGIKKNMVVIAIQHGMVGLVGKVISVGYQTSLVMPVYDSQCNVSARIGKTREVGIVSGRGSAEAPLMMSYIKKNSINDFKYGDIVVTSGENDNYLRDVPIGTVSKVTMLDYDSSLQVELIPALNFSRLETVIVVDMKLPLPEGGYAQ
jgi:rod shape-determining protein MreC